MRATMTNSRLGHSGLHCHRAHRNVAGIRCMRLARQSHDTGWTRLIGMTDRVIGTNLPGTLTNVALMHWRDV